tara:strand:- start:39 stop:1271 length:1233 start_codon:yes stop_codon:yes gene_type:complete
MKNIAVVGAGIIGICSAFFLQKSGYKVTLIDHNEPGSQTSFGHACTFANYACMPINSPSIFKQLPSLLLKKDGPLSIDYFYLLKNMSWVFQFLKNCQPKKVKYIASSLKNLLDHSASAYDEIFNEVNVSKYIENNETLYLYNSQKDYQVDQYSIDLRRNLGVDLRELDKNAIKDLEPNIAPEYYKGILFKDSKFTNNPIKISQKIFNTFLNKGGVFLNKKVKNIQEEENKLNIFYDNNKSSYDKIVICSGAWSKKLALMIGDDFPLDTERGYHVLFNNHDKLISRSVGCSQSGFYLIQIHDGIRAAGTVEIAGLQKGINNKRIKMIEREARKLLPSLNEVKSTWIGFRPTLPDSMPVIGQSPKNKKVYYAFGHQHIGWTSAAITGKAIQYTIEDKKQNFDLSPFNPQRFV